MGRMQLCAGQRDDGGGNGHPAARLPGAAAAGAGMRAGSGFAIDVGGAGTTLRRHPAHAVSRFTGELAQLSPSMSLAVYKKGRYAASDVSGAAAALRRHSAHANSRLAGEHRSASWAALCSC